MGFEKNLRGFGFGIAVFEFKRLQRPIPVFEVVDFLPRLHSPKMHRSVLFVIEEIYQIGIGFPVFPVTSSGIFYFFLRSLIPDKLPEEEK
jgi:hypothetical protein